MAEEQENPKPIALPRVWQPGQHLTVIGQTGQGKSTVIAWLLTQRKYWMVLKSKPDEIEYEGAEHHRTVASLQKRPPGRFLLEPKYSQQATEFAKAYELAWREGGWTVDIDELFYHDDQLKLRDPINRLLTQGRSKGISVVSGMQRPSGVTRFAIGESTHVLSFQLEGRDALIYKDAASPRAAKVVQLLRRHEFVWYRRPDFIAICKLNLSNGQLEWKQVSADNV